MDFLANISTAGARGIAPRHAANDSAAFEKRSNAAKKNGIPHWNVAFTVAGQCDVVNVTTYAYDKNAAVGAARMALISVEHTLLWAFTTLDPAKVQDLLFAAQRRQRSARKEGDLADQARAREDIVRFQRELEILERSIQI